MYYFSCFYTASFASEEDISYLQSYGAEYSILARGHNEKQAEQISQEDIHVNRSFFNSQWCVHSKAQKNTHAALNSCSFLYDSPLFEFLYSDIDSFLSQLSRSFDWCIIPWGVPKRFLTIVLISTDRIIFKSLEDQILKHGGIICSTYLVDNLLSSQAQALLLKGSYDSVYELWDTCNCAETSSFLVTDIFDDELFELFEWGEVRYKLLDTFELKSPNATNVGIYKVDDKESFKRMCALSTQEPDMLVWLSGKENIDQIRLSLPKIENSLNIFDSDLIYMQEILSDFDWFLGLDRDKSDYGDHLFIARKNEIIHKWLEKQNPKEFNPICIF